MIHWVKVYESYLAKDVSESALFEAFVTHLASPAKHPCSTEGVERHINLFTQASKNVIGNERRDGYFKVQIESNQLIPSYNADRLQIIKKKMPYGWEDEMGLMWVKAAYFLVVNQGGVDIMLMITKMQLKRGYV